MLVGLGSDGYSPRMWDEFKTALHVQKLRARDPRVAYAEAYAAAFLNNRDHRQERSGAWTSAASKPAPSADLILVDYFPPTPLDSRQPVRPSAVRHCQRARRFADGERPLGGAR